MVICLFVDYRIQRVDFHQVGTNNLLPGQLILYTFRAIVLCTRVYFQQTAQYLVLMPLHVSATDRSHLQGDAVFGDKPRVLRLVLWLPEVSYGS
jgi:hypothetical protein